MNSALLVEGDPIASAALGELSRPDLAGSFVACPIDGDVEKLKASQTGQYYIAASTALLNAAPDLRGEAQLGVGVYVFGPKPNDEVREAFVATYGIVDLFKEAHGEVDRQMGPHELAGVKQARAWVLEQATESLAAEGRRLIGGYAVLASVAAPKSYTGFIYYAKRLMEEYQFVAREAALQGVFDNEVPEGLRRSMLVMHAGSQVETAALGTIVRKLLPGEKLEAALNGATPE